MAQTPEEMHARCAGALRVPAVQDWDTWPFEGEVVPKPLDPLTPEPVIHGAGGVDCSACGRPDDECLWADERWQLTQIREPGGLPVVVCLWPREHFAGPAELPEDLAREQGVMLGRVERAVLTVPTVAMVHIGRWGEGAEHLHWWFIGRPRGFGQLRSSFAEIWDEVLPPVPREIWDENLALVVRALEAG